VKSASNSDGFIEAVNGFSGLEKKSQGGYRTTNNLINVANLVAGKLEFNLPS